MIYFKPALMNYKKTLEYLYAALPMFHRIGAAAYKANLDNTLALCKMLDYPEKTFPSIHIAGTNGKGSVSHMLASVFQASGYRTGLYTSPHLKDFRERIRINGKMISRSYVTEFVEKFKNDFEKIQPSFFEWTVALAFEYFRNRSVDIAIIETGLGGRLDSTNVINPALSVITNISFDHTQLLGDTLQKIASEKAGIIKKYRTVVIGETRIGTREVFLQKAKSTVSPIFFADKELSVVPLEQKRNTESLKVNVFNIDKKISFPFNQSHKLLNLELDLTGGYQLKNIKTVLMALSLLHRKFPFSEQALRKGIRSVSKSTGLMGRWQTLSNKPLVIADTAHNIAGVKEVLQQIKRISFHHLHFVLGMVSDKSINEILKILPRTATYYFCKANIPRALVAEELARQAAHYKLKGSVYASVKSAFNAAKKSAGVKDLVLITGSNFTVAEII